MALHDLTPVAGATRDRKRKGRGPGSGLGKTAGKGHKGQKARSGGKPAVGFEGGQMPLHRRLPKRGFRNDRFAKVWAVVSVEALRGLEAGVVLDLASAKELGLVRGRKRYDGLKIIGKAELPVALTVKAAKVTKGAAASIEAAGGTIEGI